MIVIVMNSWFNQHILKHHIPELRRFLGLRAAPTAAAKPTDRRRRKSRNICVCIYV